MPTDAWALLGLVVALAVLAGLGLLFRRRANEAGIFIRFRTKAGPVIVFTVEDDDGCHVRVLSAGGMYQSACYLDERRPYDLVFEYTKLYDRMFEAKLPGGSHGAGRRVRNALMIGGGGYSYPKHYVAAHPNARMDVVEIDPVVTDLAWRHFFLDRLFSEFDLERSGRLGLVCEDGRAYLERYARELAQAGAGPAGKTAGLPAGPDGRVTPAPYDAVLIDTFHGRQPVPALCTVEAARAAKGCLAPDGLYLANVVSALQGADARLLRAMVRTLGEAFAHVCVIPCAGEEFADRDNTMVIASDGAYRFTGAYDVGKLGVTDADPILTDADNPVLELAGYASRGRVA